MGKPRDRVQKRMTPSLQAEALLRAMAVSSSALPVPLLSEADAILKMVSPGRAKRTGAPRSQLELPQFSEKLEQALAELLPSEDPWDAAEFEPAAFINKLFPDNDALGDGQLDNFLRTNTNRYQMLSETLSRDVLEHSLAKKVTHHSITEAATAIHDLMARMGTISGKAMQAEAMVEDICRDIKSLDYSVQHVNHTIRALRNLHMLISVCQQLDVFTAHKQYKEAASLFRAIADVFSLFDQYGTNPKVQALKASIEQSKSAITGSIIGQFHTALSTHVTPQDPMTEEMIQDLHSACAIIDVVDPKVKHDLIGWFTKLHLEPYEKKFAPGQEQGTLEHADKRYGWMRVKLRDYDKMFANVFPPDWDVPAIMARDFCRITHAQLTEIIEREKLTLDANVLMKVLQKTREFEREMDVTFKNTPGQTINRYFEEGIAKTNTKELATLIKAKYKHKAKEEEEKRVTGTTHTSSISFESLIGDAFQPYMAVFVELERNNISDLVRRLETEEHWVPVLEAETTRELEQAVDTEAAARKLSELQATAMKPMQHLDGADSLFLYIKNSLKRGRNLAGSQAGQTIFNLFREFQSGLGLYLALLDSRLNLYQPADSKKDKHAAQRPKEGEVSRETLQALLLIINTCEYVQETLPALESGIQDALDDLFKEHISLASVSQDFAACLNRAVKVLVAAITSDIKTGPLADMAKMPWSTWSSVGDQSEYINKIHVCLQTNVAEVRRVISNRYFALFCTQLASAVIPDYVATIFKLRRVTDVGGHQLALDANVLKSILLKIPDVGKEEGKEAPVGARGPFRAFTRYVTREMGRVESLLKTLVCEPGRMATTYSSLFPKATANDLMKLMALRGIDSGMQKAYMEAFNATAKKEDKLVIEKEKGKNILSLGSASQLMTQSVDVTKGAASKMLTASVDVTKGASKMLTSLDVTKIKLK
eukprot:g55899.t1